MLRKFLDLLGSFFVYTSPPPYQGYSRFLIALPTRKLKQLAGTNTHYSKQKLVDIILSERIPTSIEQSN